MGKSLTSNSKKLTTKTYFLTYEHLHHAKILYMNYHPILARIRRHIIPILQEGEREEGKERGRGKEKKRNKINAQRLKNWSKVMQLVQPALI